MHPLHHIDVFTDRAGFGNPVAVVLDADALDTAAMQRFAAWINLSETTFVLRPTTPEADYRVRIFTPAQELPFAGHPSVGTAWCLLDRGRVHARDGALVQECAAGLLPLRTKGDGAARRVAVRAPRARIRAADAAEHALLDAAVPRPLRAGDGAAWHIDNGPGWWVVELRDEAAVRRLVPMLPAIAAACVATHAVGVAVFAQTAAGDAALAVRAFCPADGIPEDPVTGSVNAGIAALLLHTGRLAALGGRYRASQGRELGRDGRLDLEADADGEIWVGGTAVAVAHGELRWA